MGPSSRRVGLSCRTPLGCGEGGGASFNPPPCSIPRTIAVLWTNHRTLGGDRTSSDTARLNLHSFAGGELVFDVITRSCCSHRAGGDDELSGEKHSCETLFWVSTDRDVLAIA